MGFLSASQLGCAAPLLRGTGTPTLRGGFALMVPAADAPQVGIGVIVARHNVVDLVGRLQTQQPGVEHHLTLPGVTPTDAPAALIPVRGELVTSSAVHPLRHLGQPAHAWKFRPGHVSVKHQWVADCDP